MNDSEKRKAFDSEVEAVRADFNKLRTNTLGEIDKLMGVALLKIQSILRAVPTDYQVWLLPQLESQIKDALASLGPLSTQLAKDAALESWEKGILFIDSPLLQASISVSSMLPAMDTRQLVAIQHFMTSKIEGITLSLFNKINSQLGLVVMGVQPVGDAITLITDYMTEGDRARSLRIVRTELGRVYSIAAHQRKLASAKYLPGMQKQWRKSSRLHPRLTHAAADGQIRNIDEPFAIGAARLMYPHDPKAPAKEVINCGCHSLPYMSSWEVKVPGALPLI